MFSILDSQRFHFNPNKTEARQKLHFNALHCIVLLNFFYFGWPFFYERFSSIKHQISSYRCSSCEKFDGRRNQKKARITGDTNSVYFLIYFSPITATAITYLSHVYTPKLSLWFLYDRCVCACCLCISKIISVPPKNLFKQTTWN